VLDLSIIIVNYNTQALLAACLRSVFVALDSVSAEVWVVDNTSADDSVQTVRSEFPTVQLIVNQQNVGFARANNQALRQAQGRVWVLLNPDTQVAPEALLALRQAFVTKPAAGIIGPQLLNADGSVQPSCGEFASPRTEFVFQFFLFKLFPSAFPLGSQVHPWQVADYQRARRVDWVSGACLAIRREAAEKVGLLDESIFMYGEDMEWCWRVRQAGYSVWFWPESKVTHYAHQASHSNYATWITNYTTGHLSFVTRYRSRTSAALVALMICVGSVLRIGLWTLIERLRPGLRHQASQRILGYQQAFRLGSRVLSVGRLAG